MADRDFSQGGSNQLAASAAMQLPVKLLTFEIDFAEDPMKNQSGDTLTIQNLPAGVVILGGAVNVIRADTDAGTVTYSLGITGATTLIGATVDAKTVGRTWTDGTAGGELVDDAGTDQLLLTLGGTISGDLNGKVECTVLAVSTSFQ